MRMAIRSAHAVVTALCCGLLAACEPTGGARPSAAGADSAQRGAPPAAPGDAPAEGGEPEQRPDTRRIPISIEGTVDTIEVLLVRAPDDLAMRFSTYVPEDMSASFARERRGDAFRVHANFGGVANEQAYVEVLIYPAGTSAEAARDSLREAVRALHPDVEIEPQIGGYVWAEEAHAFRYHKGGGVYLGLAALGRHDDHYFRLIRHYPGDYGDGMGPRVASILEQWRWADGSPL